MTTQTSHPITITISVVDRGAKVDPPIQHVHAGDHVEFKLVDLEGGYVFFLAPSLFDRQHLTIPGETLEVQPTRKGAYPYFVLVRGYVAESDSVEEMVAEGNSMPVFVMD